MAKKNLEIMAAQEIVKKAGFDPGPIDGIPGTKTYNGFREYLNIHVPDDEIKVLDTFRKFWPHPKISGIVIKLKGIKMLHYTNKIATFWVDEAVHESFVDLLLTWPGIDKLRMTETLRTLEVQKRLKKQKPSLAAEPGWSLHGHGRAFDFDISTAGNLLHFYTHCAQFGWYNIYSKRNDEGKIPVVLCKGGREAWHMQRVDPPGIHKNTYLKKWASTRGGVHTLMQISYEYDRKSIVTIHS